LFAVSATELASIQRAWSTVPEYVGDATQGAHEVVLDVSAKTPAGGYAIGQQVTYRQGNAQYTIRSYTGYAIGPPGPGGPKCQAQENAITAAWQGP